jgi:putative membrane protein
MDSINGKRRGFWRDALAIEGSITPHVLPHVVAFGAISGAIVGLAHLEEQLWGVRLALEVAPYEIAGAALGLLLILRTNAGYDRWWEARRLWGGIVNQARNLAIDGLAYGPSDPQWRRQWVAWTAAFPHVARASLRNHAPGPELAALIGEPAAAQVAASGHMPSFVALALAELLRQAREQHGMDSFAFVQTDKERALLIDHVGACERILKTPLPRVYAIKIRRFIALFLLTLPIALLHKVERTWLIPLISMMVAYPIISLDQIGVELQNPFDLDRLSHLPLNEISQNIEKSVTGTANAAPRLAAIFDTPQQQPAARSSEAG